MGHEAYEVEYHSLVADDLERIDASWKKRIQYAIETKLMTQPDLFGAPLRQSLAGYRKLRVGDYRVVYRIEKKTVQVIAIVHRSGEYKKARRRAR